MCLLRTLYDIRRTIWKLKRGKSSLVKTIVHSILCIWLAFLQTLIRHWGISTEWNVQKPRQFMKVYWRGRERGKIKFRGSLIICHLMFRFLNFGLIIIKKSNSHQKVNEEKIDKRKQSSCQQSSPEDICHHYNMWRSLVSQFWFVCWKNDKEW